MNNRARGDHLERRVRLALINEGWIVVRAAGSLGVADLVALQAGRRPALLQVKIGGYLAPESWNLLVNVAELAGADPVLASRETGNKLHYRRLTGEREKYERQADMTEVWEP